MKLNRLPLILGALTVVFFSSFIALYPNGAPAAKTGSPGDGSDCTECHGGTASTVTGWITSNIPASGYVPGQTYQITATNSITGSGKMGFEVSPQNASGAQLGTLAAGSGTQLVGNGKYVTHTNANSTTNSWTFNWTAPAAGTGAVTFYGAFARNKPGPVRLSTLVVNEAASLPAGAGPISGTNSVCKYNSYTYSIGTISGATSYNWSVPAGATISSGQGTTSVSVNFGASAASGNVSVYGSNSAGNGTPSTLAVTVNDVPAVAATPSGPDLVDLHNTASSNYTTTGSANATSYMWEISPANAGIISGTGLSSTVTWAGSFMGDATIRVKAVNACGNGNWSSVKQTHVINTTGVDETVQGSKFSIYPNPNYGRFNLELKGESATALLRIIDLSGKEVYKGEVNNQGINALDLNLNRGIYILIVNEGNRTLKQKLFIQ